MAGTLKIGSSISPYRMMRAGRLWRMTNETQKIHWSSWCGEDPITVCRQIKREMLRTCFLIFVIFLIFSLPWFLFLRSPSGTEPAWLGITFVVSALCMLVIYRFIRPKTSAVPVNIFLTSVEEVSRILDITPKRLLAMDISLLKGEAERTLDNQLNALAECVPPSGIEPGIETIGFMRRVRFELTTLSFAGLLDKEEASARYEKIVLKIRAYAREIAV